MQKCYLFVQKNGKSGRGLTYPEAVDECKNQGGNIWEPVDQYTNDLVHKAALLSLKTFIWIGVHKNEDGE
jgi:hypothetical protein